MTNTNIDTFQSTRVFLTPTGEYVLALPIFADEKGSIFNKSDMEKMTGVSVSVGFYDHIGYIIYHPEFGEHLMNREVTDSFFEDLGSLNE